MIHPAVTCTKQIFTDACVRIRNFMSVFEKRMFRVLRMAAMYRLYLYFRRCEEFRKIDLLRIHTPSILEDCKRYVASQTLSDLIVAEILSIIFSRCRKILQYLEKKFNKSITAGVIFSKTKLCSIHE